MPKPIRVMSSGLTNRIWALRRYKEAPPGYVVSSSKDDVTQDALRAAIDHIKNGCELEECACQFLQFREACGAILPVPVPGERVKACILAPRHNGKHSDFAQDWD